ncbi:hypothetical protein [Desulforhopalus singaporensis]|uniref:Polysaccharide deacetylase n=1 Tax=Desulforhopalus singaporensis TaxID=91360 RepID=A0A1H0KRR2_9BACT|nr:hypothetical protein [Desulforhopalus singaporensis]SDO58473.1 hypothetical protein SAMN05660330_00599 [Desulforhopalus singaporensis]
MNGIEVEGCTVALPMPLFLLVEDVGWWQGYDGSSIQQPYRNRFARRHCLADYRALAELGRKLSMRIGIGMVIGEWDRSDWLANVSGATWMGRSWDNSVNRTRELDRAAAFLNEHQDYLELAVHGLCHEFWINGEMVRSEFHDESGTMRPQKTVRSHLRAFFRLLDENCIVAAPRLFVPPALNHSFGNGPRSFQALLREWGIRYVITRFARARHYSPPVHPLLTWEEGVAILERGIAPAAWHQSTVLPGGTICGPVLPLHWGNLLHLDPRRNMELIDPWAEAILARAKRIDCTLSPDVEACFRQAAVCLFGQMNKVEKGVEISLERLPELLPAAGGFVVKIRQLATRSWRCSGANLRMLPAADILAMEIIPHPGVSRVRLFCR